MFGHLKHIYKITKIVRTLWLAERRACMKVCNHGCDVTLSVSATHFKAISLTLKYKYKYKYLKKFKWRKLFQVLIWDWPSLPLWARGKKAKERRTTALVSNLDDLVEGTQAKTTKYATKYAVNVFKVIFAFNYYNKILKITFCFFFKFTIQLNANSMLQTANVLKSNFTRPIGCRVLAVKGSKNDHLNLEECTR